AVETRHVEDVVEDGHAPAVALLEQLEARHAAPERHQLPVEDEVPGRLALERLGDLRELVVHPPCGPRHQAHAGAVPDRDAADAVELALEDPLRVRERLVGEDRLHGLDHAPSSSIVRPLTTDSGRSATGSPLSASSSRRLTSSQRRPSMWRIDQPPRSFWPSSRNEAWPASSASSIGSSRRFSYVPRSQTITGPAPY